MQSFLKWAYQVSRCGGAVAVLAFPISVSLSQFGLLIAVFSWVALRVGKRLSSQPQGAVDEFLPFPKVPELFVAVGIYAVFFVSLLVNAALSPSFQKVMQHGMRDEMRHVGLIAMAFWIYAYASTESRKEEVLKWIKVAAAITFVAGFVSIFSLYRLGKIPYHITHGWQVGPEARFQHYMTTISPDRWKIHLYLPIGFMNTHLTYAAHLCMLLPLFLFRTVHLAAFFKGRLFSPEARPQVYRFIYNILILLLAGFILVLNNGRSAMVGLVAALGFGLYYYMRTEWAAQRARILVPIVVLLLLVAAGLTESYRRGGTGAERIVSGLLGQKKHTDYQRNFVWQAAMKIAQKNPVIGVGPGRFESEVNKVILELSRERPSLWYAYSIIQRGHAHNDALHLLAVGGPSALALYALFFAALLRTILSRSKHPETGYLRWGLVVIFFGGLFQCYFQGDQVLLPFWVIAGLVLRDTHDARGP